MREIERDAPVSPGQIRIVSFQPRSVAVKHVPRRPAHRLRAATAFQYPKLKAVYCAIGWGCRRRVAISHISRVPRRPVSDTPHVESRPLMRQAIRWCRWRPGARRRC